MRARTTPTETTGRSSVRSLCAPELFVDAQAREVARLVVDNDRLEGVDVRDLIDAVEAYDLASARMQWACACQPDIAHDDHVARDWHSSEQRQAYVTMLSVLRRSTGERHETLESTA